MVDTPLPQTTIDVRVRYVECDPMGFVHHTVYPVWFEMARTELLREQGIVYAELEKRGDFIVVAKIDVTYRRPAKYDDVLQVVVIEARVSRAKIIHEYKVLRDGELICSGTTTLACIDGDGRPRPVGDVIPSMNP